jgi:hypothetical protein
MDPCMISNKTLPLIAWKLEWIEICVCWFLDECSLCSSRFECLIYFSVIFLMFCVNFQLWFCISLNLCLGLFSGQTLVFGSVHGWTSVFGSTHLVLFWVKYLRLCLFEQPFVKDFFGLRGCLANTHLNAFWQFLGKEKMFFPNIGL